MTTPTVDPAEAGETIWVVTTRLDSTRETTITAYNSFAVAYEAKVTFCRTYWIDSVHGEMPATDAEVIEAYFATGRDEVLINRLDVQTTVITYNV